MKPIFLKKSDDEKTDESSLAGGSEDNISFKGEKRQSRVYIKGELPKMYWKSAFYSLIFTSPFTLSFTISIFSNPSLSNTFMAILY
jgi:hypothetical protein